MSQLSTLTIGIKDSWKPFFQKIQFPETLIRTLAAGDYYPSDPFKAFKLTDEIKVVILGQDPYINKNEAMGLAFSCASHVPPSLKNIFKEISECLGTPIRMNPDLTDWAQQGVFLLNSILTVAPGKSKSHAGIGWESITDAAIRYISTTAQRKVVFMLWGNEAKKKKRLIDPRHIILEAGHPSPLSVRYFRGCKHFKTCNELLDSPINWG